MMYAMVVGGLILLLLGGEALVRSSVSLAERLGISRLVIGLTIVAFGTSAPELLVSIQAVLHGAPAIAVGNVVGSNIANVLLVVGLSALIAPFICQKSVMQREGLVMLAATVLFIGLSLIQAIQFWSGLLMVLLLAGFLWFTYRASVKDGGASAADEVDDLGSGAPKSLLISIVMLIFGIAGLLVGSSLLVDGARAIAIAAGISETVVGVTVVALGTSLPELATAVIAAVRRHGDVAIGNVIGSNIFNILGIMGITSLVAPVPVAQQVLAFDLWVMLAAAAVLFPLAFLRLPVGRIAGLVLLIGYAAYVVAQFTGVSGMPVDQLAGLR